MNGLDLFAGSGIGSLAFRHTIPDYRTCCYVENDPYCQAVLIARIKDGLLDDAPIWDDIRTFDGTKWHGRVDIISGGFPCQPFSVAGQRKGEADERNLWPDTVRIIGEVRPRYAFLENVPGLISSGYFETILCDLAKIGYDCEWDIVGASDVGANHRRKRLYILAYPAKLRGREEDSGRLGVVRNPLSRQERQKDTNAPQTLSSGMAYPDQTRQPQPQGIEQDERGRIGNGSQDVADSETVGQSQSGTTRTRGDRFEDCGSDVSKPTDKRLEGEKPEGELSGGQSRLSTQCGWWSVEPDVGRVDHGVALRVDRLKMLGNGWVPAVVARILKSG